MRPQAALLLALSFAACSIFNRGGRNDFTDSTVASNVSTTLSVARTQLEHHGYQVMVIDSNTIRTKPKALQRYQRDTTGASGKGDQWFLQVQVAPAGFTAGTRMRVQGFVIPRVVRAASGATQVNAIPVEASDKQLYSDVRAAARWIADEANRKGPRQSGGERPKT